MTLLTKTQLRRRETLGLGFALAAAAVLGPAAGQAQELPPAPEAPPAASAGLRLGPATPFTPETVREIARELATRPFEPLPEISPAWRGLSYDEMREIWFDGQHALFRDHGAVDQPSAAQVEFFVAGLYQHNTVQAFAVENGEAREVLFDLGLFTRTDRFPHLPPEGTGFSGLRLTGEIETPGTFQEYAVFQGASYLRAVGKGQQYGLSARGLAVDTVSERAEEFPVFRRFWVEKAAPDAEAVVVHALLDSASITGAFRYVIRKGEVTEMEVSSQLFPRTDLAHVGIAPGTSMYLFSDLNRLQFDDFREGVHDSDGLLMANGQGEILWRPLANPAALQASWFVDQGPRGFGLIQRARLPENYNDLAAHYERRPSLWVEPLGDWGKGAVVLVEIPTDMEINDNIVAYWEPAEGLRAGQEYRFDYRLHWADGAPPVDGERARVIATRTGARVFEEGRMFAIDFEAHPALEGGIDGLDARVTTTAGHMTGVLIHPNPATGGVRVDATLILPDDQPSEIRVELWRGGREGKGGTQVGESWLYRWVPA